MTSAHACAAAASKPAAGGGQLARAAALLCAIGAMSALVPVAPALAQSPSPHLEELFRVQGLPSD